MGAEIYNERRGVFSFGYVFSLAGKAALCLLELDTLAARFQPGTFSSPGGRLENSPAVRMFRSSAGFPTCCIAGFLPAGRIRPALLLCMVCRLEIDTAGWKPALRVCAGQRLNTYKTLGYFRPPLRGDNLHAQSSNSRASNKLALRSEFLNLKHFVMVYACRDPSAAL
jgi:hypothetical protein